MADIKPPTTPPSQPETAAPTIQVAQKPPLVLPMPQPTVKPPQLPSRYRSDVFRNPPWQNKRRILFICHDGKPYGAQKSLELMLRHLPADQYHCFVSFGRSGPFYDQLSELPNVTTLRHQRMMWVKHSQRNSLKRLGDRLSLLLNVNRVFPLLETCQQFKIDLIHTNSLVSMEGALTAKILGIPHIWHIREWFEEYNPRFQLTLGDALTKQMVHLLSSQVVCVSDIVRRQFHPWVEQDPGRYRVLYNSVDTEKLIPTPQPPNLEAPLQLAYFGRISDGKRFGDIIDALIHLKAFYPYEFPFKLWVYGEYIDERYRQHLELVISRHQLQPYVVFCGYQNDIGACMVGKDLVVLPSTNESFGRSIIEGMAAGIPILAAQSGGPTELFQSGHHGFFFKPKDPHDLAQQLIHIEHHRQQLADMRSNVVARAKKVFDVSVQQHQLQALYDELLTRTPVF
ncbi:MAG: glycosyltransferase family 4 protein [Cyanobacteria bacterium HKST-UBA05]|nr:glycosyltransferase family 4 protein [Cyanobacteria bacterium HKST-UBA05]